MEVYYLARGVSIVEWQALGLSEQPDVVIYEDQQFVPKQIQPKQSHPAAVLTTETGSIHRQCLSDIAAFAYTPTNNGKSLIETLTFDGAEHWFYLRMSLFYRYHSVVVAAERVKKSLQTCGIDIGQVTALHIFHLHPTLPSLLPGLPVHLHLAKHTAPTKTPVWMMLQYLLLFVMRAMLGLWQLRLLLNTTPKNVLITDPELLQEMVALHRPNTKIWTDTYFSYLLEAVKNRRDFLILSEIQPPRLDNARRRRISRRLILPAYTGQTLNFDVFTFLTLLNPLTYLQLYRAYRRLKAIRSHSELSPSNQCLYQLLPGAYPLILQGVFRHKAARLFARLARVSTLCTPNEHAVNNKPIIQAVKMRGATTIGVQHGTLSVFYHCHHPLDNAYQHLPDYTIFWGNDYLQSLIRINPDYSTNNAVCLGQLRTDAIPMLSQSLRKSQIHPQLSDDRPLLLYLSQPFVGNEQPLRQQLAVDFLLLQQHYPQYQLAIKPHPLETDHQFFYHIAEQTKHSNLLLLTQELYHLLAVADIVITYHSTAGAEAVYFKKTLLVADYLHNDAAGYIREGVGLGYHNAQELVALVADVMQHRRQINPQQQDLFIKNRANKIDGQTAARYLDFILSVQPSNRLNHK